MFNNGRKNICVILCDVTNHYQEQVCKTITSHAESRGYNVAFFSHFTCYGIDTRNGLAEANIIHLVPYEQFDGFILCHDTFSNEQAAEQMFEYIEQKTSAPVVTLRRQYKEYACVLAENAGFIRNMVNHFVDIHGFDRIAFMSGPADHPDAQKRLEDYREGLEDRGIAYREELVFWGDFWRKKAKEAVRYFTKELPELPQAIICANDYMAIALCNELLFQGIMVPEEIAVSGFDDIWEASVNVPPMTTVAMPVEKMTETAFDTLEKMMEGKDVSDVQIVQTEPVIRESCGCQDMDSRTTIRQRVRQNKENESIQELVNSNMHMIVEIAEVECAEELVEHARILGDRDN